MCRNRSARFEAAVLAGAFDEAPGPFGRLAGSERGEPERELLGQALAAALVLARQIAAFPQACLRNDRLSARRQHGLSMGDALAQEFALGLQTLASGEAEGGARRFVEGAGKHGRFGND